MGKKSLTEKVMCYQQGKLGRIELVKEIAAYSYTSFETKRLLSEDQRGDFMCYFYKEMSSLIDKYNYNGKPFEVYLDTILKWRIRSFLRLSRKKRDVRLLLRDGRFLGEVGKGSPIKKDEWIQEEGSMDLAVLNIFHPDSENTIPAKSDRRRLLYIFFREYPFLNLQNIARIAELTDSTLDWLFKKEEELQSLLQKRIDHRQNLVERRNGAFFRLYFLEKKLRSVYLESESKSILSEIKKTKRRLGSLNGEIARAAVRPTHREIGNILGVPKGTVDSGMYYIRKSFLEKKNADGDLGS